MRKTTGATVAIMCAGFLLISGPTVSTAQEQPPAGDGIEGVPAATVSITGMYAGSASGSGQSAGEDGKGKTPITVWVIEDGSTARFTFRADKIGLTVDFQGPLNAYGTNDYTVPLNVDSPVMKGTGVVSFNYGPSGWVIGGSGRGSAMGWEGSGRGGAVRIKTEVVKPGFGEQIGDALGGLFGGGAPPETSVGGPDVQLSDPPAEGADAAVEASQAVADVTASAGEAGVEPDTEEIDPDDLEQTVPMSITEQLSALGGLIVVLVIGLFL